MSQEVEERLFATKTGTVVTLRSFRYAEATVFELTNHQVAPDTYMVYIHGGPNLSCLPYIADTEQGGFRSLDPLLRHTNILLLEQMARVTVREFAPFVDEQANAARSVTQIAEAHGPSARAKLYIDAIRNHLAGTRFGIFAQSFGAQVLFSMLPHLESGELRPEYLTLSSPFLGVSNSDTFVSYRRKILRGRAERLYADREIETLLGELARRIAASGATDSIYHKIAVSMAHPAHPEGLIKKGVVSQLKALSGLKGPELVATLTVDAPDLVNFVVGSEFFTPGSNMYEATRKDIERSPYTVGLPDEGVWMAYSWEEQFGGKDILTYKSEQRSPKEDMHLLCDCAKVTPTWLYLDALDFLVPVQEFAQSLLPQIDGCCSIEWRAGYGHWLGHSTFGRVLGEMV